MNDENENEEEDFFRVKQDDSFISEWVCLVNLGRVQLENYVRIPDPS